MMLYLYNVRENSRETSYKLYYKSDSIHNKLDRSEGTLVQCSGTAVTWRSGDVVT